MAREASSRAWAVVVERDGVVVGDVALWATEQSGRRGELGWVFHPDHSGQGLATEAVGAVIRTAFDTFGMHRLVAQMDARNTASVRASRDEAGSPSAPDHWNKEEWADVVIYGLLASDRTGWLTRSTDGSTANLSRTRSPPTFQDLARPAVDAE